MSKEKRSGFQALVSGHVLLFALCSLLFSLLITSCGFHLRGAGSVSLPPELSILRVVVEDRPLTNDPLRRAMLEVLQSEGRVTVADEQAQVPALVLLGERVDRQVLAVSGSTARVSGYLLKYHLSFRVEDSQGGTLIKVRTVSLQRDFTFDSQNVLAKEREEADLQQAMRGDAVRQVLRQLAGAHLPPAAEQTTDAVTP